MAALLATLAACSGQPSAPAPEEAAKTIDVTGIPSEIRILVAPSGTYYRVTDGQAGGVTVDTATQFVKWLNEQPKSNTFSVVFVETAEDALIPDLVAGKGDIAANMLLTFERDDQVAFATPFISGIRELVVTGPGEKPLVSLEDIGGRSIHVRKASDHHASLVRLNDQLIKINRPPAKILIAPATRTDEDLLESVNAGKIPSTLADDYIFNRWRKTLPHIAANPDVAVSQDGVLAWVTRKDTPKLLVLMNEFFGAHKVTF